MPLPLASVAPLHALQQNQNLAVSGQHLQDTLNFWLRQHSRAWRQTASAVALLSPVTTMTRMPAARQSSMAGRDLWARRVVHANQPQQGQPCLILRHHLQTSRMSQCLNLRPGPCCTSGTVSLFFAAKASQTCPECHNIASNQHRPVAHEHSQHVCSAVQ